jgi:two-component system nitrate/nitrite response regulator NarL
VPIRVLLVDDHALFRGGIRMLLARQPDFDVVGEASDGLDGVKRANQLRPDLVLLDLHMPGLSGREALRVLVQDLPGIRVVMLTVSEDAEDLLDCLRSGASGYLLKNTDIDAFTAALRRVHEGDSVVSPEMTGKLVSGVRARHPAEPSPLDRLTPREREILRYVATGAANKEIARTLALAESTVKIHVQAILRKLGLQSRVQAAVFAVERGVVQERAGRRL